MQFGILGQKAPALDLTDWVNADGKTDAFEPADHAGKVVVLYFFQAWCPSCHSHGFPALGEMVDAYAGDDRVAFGVVQTVFEGFDANTPEKRAEQLETYGLNLPVGHDAGQRPQTITRYRTGGTPWFVVIAPDGRVAFNDYRLSARAGQRLIDGLLDAKSAPEPEEDRLRHKEGADTWYVDFAGGGTGHVETRRKGDVLHLLHSEVPRDLRGGGYGGRLMERFLEGVEAQGLRVRPVCSYTAAYLNRYKRWAHLLA